MHLISHCFGNESLFIFYEFLIKLAITLGDIFLEKLDPTQGLKEATEYPIWYVLVFTFSGMKDGFKQCRQMYTNEKEINFVKIFTLSWKPEEI